ncbi:hypothetical protein HMPREF1869_01173 [Bacteroidales bacterium KA00251]|nr:hypothetical protein HMPREF1869_01173 [Bacteroidales bacterium KA00251]
MSQNHAPFSFYLTFLAGYNPDLALLGSAHYKTNLPCNDRAYSSMLYS